MHQLRLFQMRIGVDATATPGGLLPGVNRQERQRVFGARLKVKPPRAPTARELSKLR